MPTPESAEAGLIVPDIVVRKVLNGAANQEAKLIQAGIYYLYPELVDDIFGTVNEINRAQGYPYAWESKYGTVQKYRNLSLGPIAGIVSESAGGGIDPGEDHAAAAVRETLEEVGVKVAVQFVAEDLFHNEKGQDRLFIYKAKHNGPFIPDPVEVQEVRFANLEVIGHMLESGAPFHPEFPFVWKKQIIQKAANSF